MKPAAQARIIVTFPLRCSYWSGTSTSLFTPPMGQRYGPPNILNTFLPHILFYSDNSCFTFIRNVDSATHCDAVQKKSENGTDSNNEP